MKTRTRFAAVLLAFMLCISAGTPAFSDADEQMPSPGEPLIEDLPIAEEETQFEAETPVEEEQPADEEPPTDEEQLIEEEQSEADEQPTEEEQPVEEEQPADVEQPTDVEQSIGEEQPSDEEQRTEEEQPAEEEKLTEEELLPEEKLLIPLDEMLAELPPKAAPCEVSVPAEITGDTISLSVTIPQPGTLVITAASQNGWKLIDENGMEIAYALEGLDETYTESTTDTLTLVYTLPKHIIPAGTLTDRITFNFEFTPDSVEPTDEALTP